MTTRLLLAAVIVAGCLTACSKGGGGSPAPAAPPGPPRNVHITWLASHETGVNSAGGGYQVFVTGQPMANVPYVSGPTAPTSYDVVLSPGSYAVTVRAFAALDLQGGAAGNVSAPSQSINVTVP